jgi:phospholipid/cholesterol/gamma-HCH transport system permease protein
MVKPKLHNASKDPDKDFKIEQGTLYLKNSLLLADLNRWIPALQEYLKNMQDPITEINLDGLKKIDSAGVAAINQLKDGLTKNSKDVKITGGSPSIRKKFGLFSFQEPTAPSEKMRMSFFEYTAEFFLSFYRDYLVKYFTLAADVLYWSVTDIFKSRTHRKGEFYNQAVLIGVNAVYIICMLSFIIGLVIALQSAAQLRNFGANIYIVDLIVISMMRRWGL